MDETFSSSRTSEISERILLNVCSKLQHNNIKVAALIMKCEEVDHNGDGFVHYKDIRELMNSILPFKDWITEREMVHICSALKSTGETSIKDNGGVAYIRLFDVLDESKYGKNSRIRYERWMDDDDLEIEKWATQKGSLGEWLKRAACPAEIKNFKKLISRLEDYERSSGMNCSRTPDGFIIPMGPDLKASVQFYTS
mmetsp:Transcript_8893/g.13261  ORF Transcript_8893/g.13261 Transcript_8893/m.13261 type:complete len:197 (+) Transcript_8893:22-612(+)